jgi:hypothetical protein
MAEFRPISKLNPGDILVWGERIVTVQSAEEFSFTVAPGALMMHDVLRYVGAEQLEVVPVTEENSGMQLLLLHSQIQAGE